jgi:hypothetical protein
LETFWKILYNGLRLSPLLGFRPASGCCPDTDLSLCAAGKDVSLAWLIRARRARYIPLCVRCGLVWAKILEVGPNGLIWVK